MGGQFPSAVNDGFQRLRQFVRRNETQDRCELCATPVAPVHRHLFEVEKRSVICVCQACALLFSAPGSKFRRVPARACLLSGFSLPDEVWDDLAIPINMAYFLRDSRTNTAKAYYPSPAGAMESLLPLDAWTNLIDSNPILQTMEPDVECLLANRLGPICGNTGPEYFPEYFIVPIDECFALVGLIRARWRGLSGGVDVWKDLAEHFAALRRRAITVEASGA